MANGSSTPFRVGAVVSRSFAIFFRNFMGFTTISLLLLLPTIVVTVLQVLGIFPTTGILATASDIVFGYMLPQVVVAAVIFATIQYMRGRAPTVGEAIGRGVSVLLPVVGTAIAVSLTALAAMVPAFLVITAQIGGIKALLAMLLLVLPVAVYVILYVAVPVCVVERPGVFTSLVRSATLTKGNRWRVLGIVLILMGATFGFFAVVGVVAFSAAQSGSVIAPAVLSILAMVLFYALSSTFLAVTYHDLRVSKEGVDLEQIASVFD